MGLERDRRQSWLTSLFIFWETRPCSAEEGRRLRMTLLVSTQLDPRHRQMAISPKRGMLLLTLCGTELSRKLKPGPRRFESESSHSRAGLPGKSGRRVRVAVDSRLDFASSSSRGPTLGWQRPVSTSALGQQQAPPVRTLSGYGPRTFPEAFFWGSASLFESPRWRAQLGSRGLWEFA